MSSGLTQVEGIVATDDESGGTFTGGTITNSTIDSSVIGGTTPAAGSFTVVAVASGSAPSPSITFQNDTDTGLFLTNANSPSIAAGGVVRLGVATGGQTVISSSITSVAVAITSAAGALGQQGSGLQVNGTNDALPGSCLSSISRFSNNDAPAALTLAKSRSGTINTMTVVASGDNLGAINFNGADGTVMRLSGQILGRCFGSAGANSMPGQIEIKTTPINTVTPSTAIVIDSSQNTTFLGSITPTQTGGVIGTTTNNNANSGSVGEIISSVVSFSSAINLTTATPANITFIPLTAGDWDISASVGFDASAATTLTALEAGISYTSATLSPLAVATPTIRHRHTFTTGADQELCVGTGRVSVATSTAAYLVTSTAFAINSLGAYGTIWARRAR